MPEDINWSIIHLWQQIMTSVAISNYIRNTRHTSLPVTSYASTFTWDHMRKGPQRRRHGKSVDLSSCHWSQASYRKIAKVNAICLSWSSGFNAISPVCDTQPTWNWHLKQPATGTCICQCCELPCAYKFMRFLIWELIEAFPRPLST